jgi:O-acetyl-ADP-ribose deacetylase (regulator of RNase III)
MPILFITLNESYTEKIRQYGFQAKTMRIEEFIPNPNRQTYYVSPANSFCFMDGGIDYALSRIIFPRVESVVKGCVRELGIQTLLGRPYLPIGSSIILDRDINRSLVIAPTMLLPQNVSGTKNAYYATMAILYNILINKQEDLEKVDILFTSLCCGYGKMKEEESIQQILDGIRDYKDYTPSRVQTNIVVNEPNLHEQPKYYQNSEFFEINPEEILRC